ncbi:MAG: DUF3082 domain-containing protein [Phormidesmis sp.]
MEKSTSPKPSADASDLENGQKPATPLRCFTGALLAGTLSLLAYRLMTSIATTFANKPIVSDNPAVVNMSSAVRTLVTGIVALGAGVFGIAALGLIALGIQLIFEKEDKKAAQSSDAADI